MSIRILVASALLAAAGCVGTLDPTPAVDAGSGSDGGGGGGAARQNYLTNVHPIMQAKCAGCHSAATTIATPFIATSTATAYESTVGFTSVVGNFTETGTPLYAKVVPGPHQGVTYTLDEQTKVKAWLAAEVSERNGTGPGPTPGPESPAQMTARLISEWSGCLKETDFTANNFGGRWSNKGSNQGNCEQCHTSGYSGFIANDDNVLMYNALSTNKFFMLAYFSVDITDMTNPKIVPNFSNFERVGLRMIPHQDHPQFDTSRQDDAMVALQQLYDLTMGYKTAGTCGPPRIPM